MLSYMREYGLKIFMIWLVLTALTPTALPQPFYQLISKAHHALAHQQPSQALNALEQAVAFEPAAQALHKPALTLALKLGEWARAETHLLALKELDPLSDDLACAEYQLQLARGEILKSDLKNLPPSIVCPEGFASMSMLASDFFSSGRYEAAIPLLESQMIFGPDPGQAQVLLALYTAATDPGKAIDALREAQAAGGPDAGLALTVLIEIQDSSSADPPAYLNAKVGQAFARADEWHLARKAFENAVRLDPEYAQAWGYLGLALDSIGLDGEIELLEAEHLAPEDPLLLILLAMHYNRNGQHTAALPILERAVALDAENPAIAAELGKTYESLGDLEGARMALRQATLLAPDEPSFWHLLASFSLRYEIEIGSLGLPAARNALILEPGSFQSWNSIGYAHYLLGNYALAERALRRAVAIAPSNPSGQYFLGLLFQAQGEREKAISAWTLASKLAPDHIDAILAKRALENLFNYP